MKERNGTLLKRLQPGRLRSAEQDRQRLAVDVPPNITPEDILIPAYWGNYSQNIRPKDILEVFCEDGSWEGQYRVLFVDKTGVRLAETWIKEYEVPESPDFQSHEIKWLGPAKKFGVVEITTNTLLRDGLYPKAAAIEFMKQHVERMRA